MQIRINPATREVLFLLKDGTSVYRDCIDALFDSELRFTRSPTAGASQREENAERLRKELGEFLTLPAAVALLERASAVFADAKPMRREALRSEWRKIVIVLLSKRMKERFRLLRSTKRGPLKGSAREFDDRQKCNLVMFRNYLRIFHEGREHGPRCGCFARAAKMLGMTWNGLKNLHQRFVATLGNAADARLDEYGRTDAYRNHVDAEPTLRRMRRCLSEFESPTNVK